MANFVPVDVFDLVIFGGTGDLAMRKLLPALYHRDGDGQILEGSRIIAASRSDLSRDEYLTRVEAALHENLREDEFDDASPHVAHRRRLQKRETATQSFVRRPLCQARPMRSQVVMSPLPLTVMVPRGSNR